MTKRILVADDGTPQSLCAVAYASALALPLGAKVTLARAIDPDSVSSLEVEGADAEDIGAVRTAEPRIA